MNNSFKENAQLVAKLFVKVVIKIYLWIIMINIALVCLLLVLSSIFLYFTFENGQKYLEQNTNYTYFSRNSDNSYTCTSGSTTFPFFKMKIGGLRKKSQKLIPMIYFGLEKLNIFVKECLIMENMFCMEMLRRKNI